MSCHPERSEGSRIMLKSRFFASLRMTTSTALTLALPCLDAEAFAGHAGEMGASGVMPHVLVAGLVGLAAILLLTILALTWVVWRLRGLDRRLRELEENRKD